MQTLKLGEPLPDLELLLPRGGSAAFALDMTEQFGGATALTGPVDLLVDGGFVFTGTPSTIWVVDDSDFLPDGGPITSATPGATAVTRVMFELTADDTLALAAGPHRGGIRYTAAGVGPVLLARGLVTSQ